MSSYSILSILISEADDDQDVVKITAHAAIFSTETWNHYEEGAGCIANLQEQQAQSKVGILSASVFSMPPSNIVDFSIVDRKRASNARCSISIQGIAGAQPLTSDNLPFQSDTTAVDR